MSILIVNQSVTSMCASFFSLLLVVDMKLTGLSHDSLYDQFVCRFWLTKKPIWCTMVTSTYGILLITLSRYIAVIYPIQYKKVRIIMTLTYCILLWIYRRRLRRCCSAPRTHGKNYMDAKHPWISASVLQFSLSKNPLVFMR